MKEWTKMNHWGSGHLHILIRKGFRISAHHLGKLSPCSCILNDFFPYERVYMRNNPFSFAGYLNNILSHSQNLYDLVHWQAPLQWEGSR